MCQWIIMFEVLYAKTLSKTHAKAGQRNAEIKTILSTIQNDLLHSSLLRQLYHFATDFKHVLLQLVGTDIENSLFKYRVSYRHLTFVIETFELLIKAGLVIHTYSMCNCMFTLKSEL